MKMVVVGGNSRDIGKTSVAAGIIRALPHRKWLAIKLTQFGYDGSPEEHDCAPEHDPFTIREENDRSGSTDTSRFLVAGARRALWVRVRWGMLETAIPYLRQEMHGEQNVIIESNSILRFFHPNVYLSVLEPGIQDFKPSARELLPRVDAFLWLGESFDGSPWQDISVDELRAKPMFPIRRDCYLTPEVANFVEARLEAKASAQYLPG